jgi:hypothetical protein
MRSAGQKFGYSTTSTMPPRWERESNCWRQSSIAWLTYISPILPAVMNRVLGRWIGKRGSRGWRRTAIEGTSEWSICRLEVPS